MKDLTKEKHVFSVRSKRSVEIDATRAENELPVALVRIAFPTRSIERTKFEISEHTCDTMMNLHPLHPKNRQNQNDDEEEYLNKRISSPFCVNKRN